MCGFFVILREKLVDVWDGCKIIGVGLAAVAVSLAWIIALPIAYPLSLYRNWQFRRSLDDDADT